ncbi:MAG: DUF58 domain-containing protein [Clostridiales bacterium]|nr:DUF58 domain-containing protein [Clostridiales bacterium]
MRFRRWLWIVLIITCLWALRYYGRPVFFYLSVSLVSVFLISVTEIVLAVISFRIEPDRDHRYPSKREHFTRRLTIRSRFFPILHIRVVCEYGHSSNKQRTKRIFHVSATKTKPAVLKIPLISEYSGLYELRVTSVELFDFMGFFRFSVPLKKQLRENPVYIPVLPKIRRFTKAPRVFSELIPPMRKTTERSENVGAREYRPGDDIRTVNWKRTAKTGVLYVKEYEKGTQDFHLLYLDLSAPVVGGKEASDTIDRLLSQAADLCAFLLREQRPVNILSFSENQDEQCNLLHSGSLEKAKIYLATRRFTETIPDEYKEQVSSFWEIGKNSLSVFSATLSPESLSFLSRFSGDLATVTIFLITQSGHEDQARLVADYYARLGVHCFLIDPEDAGDEGGAAT